MIDESRYFVPMLGVANNYDAKNWNEAHVGRLAVRHMTLDDFDDYGATVRWIQDFILHGEDYPYFLACAAYRAGIAAGVHRERQRRRTIDDLPMEWEGRA